MQALCVADITRSFLTRLQLEPDGFVRIYVPKAKVSLRVSLWDWRDLGKKGNNFTINANINDLTVFQDIARYRFWYFIISLSIVWRHLQDKRAPDIKTPSLTLLPVSHIHYGTI